MKKLVLFGDSLFGRCNKDLIEQLEKTLRGGYDVYNCAAGGWTSGDVFNKSKFISTLHSDVVFISVGTNDLAPWRQIKLDDFSSNISKTIDIFSSSRLIFLLPPPVDESKSEYEWGNAQVAEYNEALMQACDTANVEYINIGNDKDYHLNDGVHLNQDGYDKLFSLMKDVL